MRDERPVDYSDEKPDYFRAYVYASLDARTGQLKSFYADVRDAFTKDEDEMVPVKLNYTKKQCRGIFENFVKDIIPEKLSSTKLEDTSNGYVVYYDYKSNEYTYGGYEYTYSRYNEGIPFYANNISGGVDAVTGRIYSFNYDWTDAKLPSSKGVIGESRAFDSYIGYDGFDLIYELVTNYRNTDSVYGYTAETKARLVYRTAIRPTLVDAFTGKGLSYNGDEYVTTATDYNYKDIEGHKYERVIRLLGDMGIGLAGENFKPDENITEGDFETLLRGSGYYGYYYNDIKEKDASEQNKDGKISRQQAAEIMIDNMGMSEFASLDIFRTGYNDEDKIDADKVGAVAILKGMKVMEAKQGNKFMPNAKLTRGEAAEIVFRFMTCDMK